MRLIMLTATLLFQGCGACTLDVVWAVEVVVDLGGKET